MATQKVDNWTYLGFVISIGAKYKGIINTIGNHTIAR